MGEGFHVHMYLCMVCMCVWESEKVQEILCLLLRNARESENGIDCAN